MPERLSAHGIGWKVYTDPRGGSLDNVLPYFKAYKPGSELAKRGIETVDGHRERGHTTVMLSGSLWFLLQPMAEFLGVNHVIATRLAVKAASKPGRGPRDGCTKSP